MIGRVWPRWSGNAEKSAAVDTRVRTAFAKPDPDGLAGVVREELGDGNLGELLDIGTGAGWLLEMLGAQAIHAVGVDLSAPALRMARARLHGRALAHCEFRRGDMYALPFAAESFDTVTIDRVLAVAKRPACSACRSRARVTTFRPPARDREPSRRRRRFGA